MDLTNEISDAISNPVGIHSDVSWSCHGAHARVKMPGVQRLMKDPSQSTRRWMSRSFKLSWTVWSKNSWTSVSPGLSLCPRIPLCPPVRWMLVRLLSSL